MASVAMRASKWAQLLCSAVGSLDMKQRQVREAELRELLDAYREAAQRHGVATESGDYADGNSAADLIAAIYSELRRRGLEAQKALLPFLGDDDPGVRLWSASHALEFSPSEAEPVLRELIPVGVFLGLSAETTLREWHAGRLDFP